MTVGDVSSTARGSGARYNDGKPDLSLIPLTLLADCERMESFALKVAEAAVADALESIGLFQETGNPHHLKRAFLALDYDGRMWELTARVFEYGKKKYAAWNWAKGMAWSIPIACAGRHSLAILKGEVDDPESGLPHRGHIGCNLVMLLQFARWFPEGNDLPPSTLFQITPEPEEGTARRVANKLRDLVD